MGHSGRQLARTLQNCQCRERRDTEGGGVRRQGYHSNGNSQLDPGPKNKPGLVKTHLRQLGEMEPGLGTIQLYWPQTWGWRAEMQGTWEAQAQVLRGEGPHVCQGQTGGSATWKCVLRGKANWWLPAKGVMWIHCFVLSSFL